MNFKMMEELEEYIKSICIEKTKHWGYELKMEDIDKLSVNRSVWVQHEEYTNEDFDEYEYKVFLYSVSTIDAEDEIYINHKVKLGRINGF